MRLNDLAQGPDGAEAWIYDWRAKAECAGLCLTLKRLEDALRWVETALLPREGKDERES